MCISVFQHDQELNGSFIPEGLQRKSVASRITTKKQERLLEILLFAFTGVAITLPPFCLFIFFDNPLQSQFLFWWLPTADLSQSTYILSLFSCGFHELFWTTYTWITATFFMFLQFSFFFLSQGLLKSYRFFTTHRYQCFLKLIILTHCNLSVEMTWSYRTEHNDGSWTTEGFRYSKFISTIPLAELFYHSKLLSLSSVFSLETIAPSYSFKYETDLIFSCTSSSPLLVLLLLFMSSSFILGSVLSILFQRHRQ